MKYIQRIFCFFLCCMSTWTIMHSMQANQYPTRPIVTETTPLIEVCTIIEKLEEFKTPLMATSPNGYTIQDFQNSLGDAFEPIFSLDTFANIVTKATELLINQHTKKCIEDQDPKKMLTGKEGIGIEANIIPPSSDILVIGDLHGNAHSLARIIKNFCKNDHINEYGQLFPTTYIIFTGDIGDRGRYSLETWFLVLTLKLKNPHNVIILQGNHETLDLAKQYGIIHEILAKYPENKVHSSYVAYALLIDLFSLLPQVCFMGTRHPQSMTTLFIEFVHAGLPFFQVDLKKIFDIYCNKFLTKIIQEQKESAFIISPTAPRHNGFIWNSFFSDPNHQGRLMLPGGRCGYSDRYIHGEKTMEYLIRNSNEPFHKICGIIRGHDHLKEISQLTYNLSEARAEEENHTGYDPNWTPIFEATALNYEPGSFTYPVFTLTSITDNFGIDNFAYVHFNQKEAMWYLKPCSFKDNRKLYKAISHPFVKIDTPENINTSSQSLRDSTPQLLKPMVRVRQQGQIIRPVPVNHNSLTPQNKPLRIPQPHKFI